MLADISFSLRAGEVLGISGLLGAGRTELARVMAGADRFDRGRLLVDGTEARFRHPADAIARGIGLLPEDRKAQGLVPGLTVARNIALPHGRRLAPLGVLLARRCEADMAAPISEELRVKATPTQPVRLLSGGNQQKVVLGKWLAGARPHLHLRRADPRRRRRREGGDLQPDEPPDRARRRHHHDLLGAARAARHERPHPGDAPRPDSGGARGGGRDRRARAERGAGAGTQLTVPRRQFGTLIGLVLLCAALWILTPHFLTVSNLLNVVEQTSINAIVAVGMTFVILSGGHRPLGRIDRRAGRCRPRHVAAGRPSDGRRAGAGARGRRACGLVNGALISWGGLPPFIVTLGTMSIARGAALLFTEGRPISGFDAGFRVLATGRVGFVPAPVIAMAIVYAVAHFVLTRTTFGRYVYAIGGNEEATRLSGVAVRFHKTMIYGVSGLMSAIAAVMLTARLNSAQPIAGINYELDAIAATVIGGTSLMGGDGTLGGTLVGALIMGVLRNGLNLLGVSSFLQQIVIGGVIVVAVLLDTVLKRKHR